MQPALCLLLAAALAAGCSTAPNKNAPPLFSQLGDPAIEEINLLAIPVAVNLDQTPGLDGFVIKVFANNRKRPKPFPIDSGRLEILMFDGIPRVRPDEAPPEPRRTWQYTAQELKPFEFETSIGTGYQLAPAWGEASPSRNKISVVVRYISAEGGSVTSAPSIISVALK